MLNLVRLQHLENLLAVAFVGLVAGGAERRRRRVGDEFEVVAGLLCQIDKILVNDAAHAVARAVDAPDLAKAPRLQRHADQRLVDHRRRAAALGDKYFSGCHGFFLWLRGGSARRHRTHRSGPGKIGGWFLQKGSRWRKILLLKI